MRCEDIAEALGSAAETVLETMFFTIGDGAEPGSAPDEQLLRAEIVFSGEWNGVFEFQAPVACARTMAGNFAGSDGAEEMPEEDIAEIMCELANMVCGSTLGRLAGDKIFNLGKPHLVSSPVAAAGPDAVAATRALNVGDGVVAFTMAIGGIP